MATILVFIPDFFATDGDKKKHKCSHKETYSSYIYKGQSHFIFNFIKFDMILWI